MNQKVSDIIDTLELSVKMTIRNMVAKAGANGEITVDQLLALYPHTDPNVTRDERLALVPLRYRESGKFAAKLDFQKRCEILALYRKGITREALAIMYGVDRRTITHIYTQQSPHYKNVRQEEVSLGPARFADMYINDDILNRALTYKQEKDGEKPNNNKFARGKAGIHNVRGKMCEYQHRVIIEWREDQEPPGWYYLDLDGDNPLMWFSTGEDSLRTSQSCYSGMLMDITDRILGSTP